MKAPSFDSIAPEAYNEDLYRFGAVATPIRGWAAFDPDVEQLYGDIGFVAVADAFPESVLRAGFEGLLELSVYQPEGLELQFEHEAKEVSISDLSPFERLDYVRKFMWFTRLDPRLQEVAYHGPMMAVLGRLLGAKPELYQDMALLKPPRMGREKPWHQDHAYFNVPVGTPIVGVWIALDDSDPENGGMIFQAGGHKEGPLPHFNRRDWQICDADMLHATGKVAVPVPAHGCVVFNGLVPHGTPANRSGRRRRALQFHYIPTGTPRIETQDRLEIFGAEGFGATC